MARQSTSRGPGDQVRWDACFVAGFTISGPVLSKQIKTYCSRTHGDGWSGRWLTEPTDCISKVDARRILAERELRIRITSPSPRNEIPAKSVAEENLARLRLQPTAA